MCIDFRSVDRIDPWGPEMDHPPLGRSYLVVVPFYDMALIIVTIKRNSSAAAKMNCIYFCQRSSTAAKMRCSAASWHFCLPFSLYICIYIYMPLANFTYAIAQLYQTRFIVLFRSVSFQGKVWFYSRKKYKKCTKWALILVSVPAKNLC